MNTDADLDLLVSLVTQRDRLVEVAQVLASRAVPPKLGSISVPGLAVGAVALLRYRAMHTRRAGGTSALSRLRLAERVVRSSRKPAPE